METPLFFIGLFVLWFIYLLISNSSKSSTITDLEKSWRDEYFKLQISEEKIKKIEKDNILYKQETEEKIKKIEKDNMLYRQEIENNNNYIAERDKLFNEFNTNLNKGLENLSFIAADYEVANYKIAEQFNKTKKHPALKKAEDIKELKIKTKQALQEKKLMQYKYETLFKIFPDLELYVDNLQVLKENFSNDLNSFQDEIDKTQYYLSKDEFQKLSINERNQLALTRYIQRSKTNWQIGRDYELFVGYEFLKQGYEIIYFGIENKLQDLGRDIIAKKGIKTLIIQCKNWSKDKVIHEKHIAQLYGTTIQYIIETNEFPKNVQPVFITNTVLSDQAKKFANYLKIEVVENQSCGEFPRIKCNVNKDEDGNLTKIYHLPMDQQYDNTIIETEKGECFAWTVDEAVAKGFRRAKKFNLFNNNNV
ncbi:MAG: restriction endonuclease [Endomicrobiaceae bacterium]|nr:restriction endonuclease [Endomicrobiaceae bacterium]